MAMEGRGHLDGAGNAANVSNMTRNDHKLMEYAMNESHNGTSTGTELARTDFSDSEHDCCSKCLNLTPLHKCRGRLGGQCEPLSSWIILGAVFFTNILIAVPETSFGIFFDYLQDKYQSTKAGMGWSFFVYSLAGSITGLLVSPFVTIYGCRNTSVIFSIIYALGISLTTLASTLTWYIISFGVIAGVGFGGIFLSSSAIVQQCFPYNRGLATGVSTLGFTAGTILTPMFVELLLKNYSLQGALLLHGALFVQGIVFAVLLKSPKQFIQRKQPQRNIINETTTTKDKEHITLNTKQAQEMPEKSSLKDASTDANAQLIRDIFKDLVDVSVLKDVPFVLCVLHVFFLMISRVGMLSYTVSAAIHRGVAPSDASYLFTIMGFSNLVTRIISTVVLNFRRTNPVLYSGLGTLLLAISGLVMAFAHSYETFAVSMVIMGAYEGVTNTVMPMMMVHILGIERFTKSFSVLRVCNIPAPLLGAPFTGWLFDMTGDYTISFTVVGLSSVLSTVFSIAIYILMKVRRARDKRRTNHVPSNKCDVIAEQECETFIS